MQRRVGAHERVAAVPVELSFDTIAFRRQSTAAERVPDQLPVARDGLDRQSGQRAEIVRLSTSAGKEDRAVESNAPALGVDRENRGLELPQTGVFCVQRLGPGHRASIEKGRPVAAPSLRSNGPET